jgi:hypothetical protein
MGIFVYWRDYDGGGLTFFKEEDEDKAKELVVKLKLRDEFNENGTSGIRVIKGKELTVDVNRPAYAVTFTENYER